MLIMTGVVEVRMLAGFSNVSVFFSKLISGGRDWKPSPTSRFVSYNDQWRPVASTIGRAKFEIQRLVEVKSIKRVTSGMHPE